MVESPRQIRTSGKRVTKKVESKKHHEFTFQNQYRNAYAWLASEINYNFQFSNVAYQFAVVCLWKLCVWKFSGGMFRTAVGK